MYEEFYIQIGYCNYCGRPLDDDMRVIKDGHTLYCSKQCKEQMEVELEERLKAKWERWLVR